MIEAIEESVEAWEQYDADVEVTSETCVLVCWPIDCDGDHVRVAQPSEIPGLVMISAALLALAGKPLRVAIPDSVRARFITEESGED